MSTMQETTAIRCHIAELARQELGHVGDLPEGDMSEWLDSVQKLTLVVALEDTYEIAFDPEDEAGIRTVDDLVALVRTRLAAKGTDDAR